MDLSSQTAARLDALTAEVAQLAQREIESARARTTAPLDADDLQIRTNLENSLRSEAGRVGDALTRFARFVGYLHEHAQGCAATTPMGSPLHETNVAPATSAEKVTP